ncbi:MAG: hypothetical protein IPJ24_04775 [bacterium]|nr:hypothetical protein [bacterium]
MTNIWMLQGEFQMQFIGYLNLLGILVLPTYVLLVARQGFRLPASCALASALWGLLLAGIKAFMFYSCLMALFCWSVVAPRTGSPAPLAVRGPCSSVLRGLQPQRRRLRLGHPDGGPHRFASVPPCTARTSISWAYGGMDSSRAGGWRQAIAGAVTLDPVWKLPATCWGMIESVPFAFSVHRHRDDAVQCLLVVRRGSIGRSAAGRRGHLACSASWPRGSTCARVNGLLGPYVGLRAVRVHACS